MVASNLITFLLFPLLFLHFPSGESELQLNYYSKSCPKAEEIVKREVTKQYRKEGDIANSMLRNVFHDCMVGSCDASLLLGKQKNQLPETASLKNVGVRYLSKVDKIKAVIEAECPLTVSCADILALSAREAIFLLEGPLIEIKTGRKDSTQSYATEIVEKSLPNHNDSMASVLARFQSLGIDTEALVALLGSHSVGRTHCQNLVSRLYPTVDPTLDPELAVYLLARCNDQKPTMKKVQYAKNDQETPMVLDNMYYKNVLEQKGLLVVDEELGSDPNTAPFVQKMAANNTYFHEQFARAFLLLTEINPLTGDQGQVRRDCRHANKD